ncbi:MAG: histidine kinase [Paenibacillaceae bacterium]|nr:histidine kinase [Paenibacillaceae bacterium]
MKWLQYARESIKRKLIVAFVTVILLIASTVGVVQYVLTSSMLQLDLERYSGQILEQANLNINRYFKEYEQAFLFIQGSEEFYQWTREQDNFTSSYLRLNNLIFQNSIQPFVMQHPEVLSISLLNPYGYELRYNPKFPFKLGYKLAEHIIGQQGAGTSSPYITVRRSTDYEGAPIVVLTLSKQLNYYGSKAYIQMDISVDPLLTILQKMNNGEHHDRYLLDAEGTIVAHSSAEAMLTPVPREYRDKLLQEPSGAFMDKKTKQFVVFASIPNTPGWKSAIEVPYREAARTIYLVRDVTLTVTAVGIVCTVLLIYAFSSSLVKRILLLKRQLLNTKLGHIAPGPEVGGTDEIAQLGHAFNDMLRNLDSSVDELARTRVREQTAIMTAVQSQIHSHFLYNSLETINAMASVSGMKPIEEAVAALSAMIRYSSRIRDIAVTVGDEIEHTRHYLELAAIRFETIDYRYRVDSSLLSVRCPKLMLQPVLENAIRHNVEKLGLPIRLDISVRNWRNRYVLIRICDNGAGIPPEALASLRNKIREEDLDIPDGDRSIGLQNVAYRIRQFYRREGLQAELAIGNRHSRGGVLVNLILPMHTS